MLRFAIYVRVSTTEQADKGYSIGTQLEACRSKVHEVAAGKPFNIREFVDDGFSGEFIERPHFTDLRTAVINKEFDYVIVYDPDRLSRNLGHQLIVAEDIERSGAKLIFVSVKFEESSEGKLFFNMRGAISAYEKEKIKERTMRGKKGKALKGKLVNNAHPFGYTYDSEKSMYVVDENQAKIVRMIYDLIVNEKKGTSLICKELNALGIPSPRSKSSWIVSSVHRIITNTLYKGVINSMKYRSEKTGLKSKKRILRPEAEWIPIKVPAIVSEEIWQAAQNQLQDNKDVSKRNLKRDYLLAGLVYCAICGRKMTICHSGTGAISYYVCLSQKSAAFTYSAQERCAARRIPTEHLDRYVFNYLKQAFINPALIKSLCKAPKDEDTSNIQAKLDDIARNKNEMVKGRESIMQWFRQKLITEQEAQKQLMDMKHQLMDLERVEKSYLEELQSKTTKLNPEQIIQSIQENFSKDLHSVEDKKSAIRSVLEKIIVQRMDETSGRGSKPNLNVQIKFI